MSPHALKRINAPLKWVCAAAALASVFAVKAVPWPDKPLATNLTATPMTMLVAGRDHRLFYEAYNDASDIDGDGTLDTRFKPSIVYFGLFDSTLCYSFSGTKAKDSSGNNSLFTPNAVADAQGRCTSSTAEWSGNWLNYVTTSRIDALRKVLYGGHREKDTATETILRRAYIPQDAHSWAKEYTSTSTDGYAIEDYTALNQPSGSGTRRHFFGNLTSNANQNCETLSDCSNLPPVLSVVANSTNRVWDWASAETPVLREEEGAHGGTGPTYYTVRVRVCTAGYNNGCKQYPNGLYKPIGLLHEYGENNAMFFGLITGSYDKNKSGGVLRKVVSSFSDEVDPLTGKFTTSSRIVKTFNNLRIRDFNNGNTGAQYRSGWEVDQPMNEGAFVDWGNPIAEMLYEATRYFAGKKAPTSAFLPPTSGSVDQHLGLSNVTWDDPYASNSAAKAAWCARANILTISDTNVSYDSDQLPGVYTDFGSGISTDLAGLKVKELADEITAVESGITGARFIGQSNTTKDSAPTAKTVSSMGTIRGISPEEPTKEGSYYAASIASYIKKTDLRPDLPPTSVVLTDPNDPRKKNTLDMFNVALASPLPTIAAKLPNGRTITVVPFGKTVSTFSPVRTKSSFAPTLTIVDFYVDRIANSGVADQDSTVNGGRYSAKFRINFEDVEQGADHDMDVIGEYEITANADNTLTVKVTPIYEGAGYVMNFGYVLSGSTKDGVYLVAQNDPLYESYFLNTPRASDSDGAGSTWLEPGACNASPSARCSQPLAVVDKDGRTGYFSDTRTFSSSSTSSASFLKDPLWFASKWGGAQDRNGNNQPDLSAEWDSNNDGVPDTYFLVQNPLKLQEALRRAFDSITSRNGGGGNVIANSRVLSTSLSTETLVFQGVFNTAKWSGNLIAYPATAATGIGAAKWNAAQKMPEAASREIFYSTGSGAGAKLPTGTVPTDLSSHITGTTTYTNTDLLRYLRGDSAKELTVTGGVFRDRASTVTLEGGIPLPLGNAARLGDIAHSSPVYVKDTKTVYVGANDGMLHAFDAGVDDPATTAIDEGANAGRELFAFIPSAVLPRLKNIANLGYDEKHEFFVDGDIAVSTRTQTTGKNHLVAALGRGGKGLFGLDVTNVGSGTGFTASDVKWEYFNGTSDADLGYMLGRPIIAQMNNGQWAVLVGNGYESNSGLAALYIFKLDDGTLLKKFTLTSAGTGNGMATPGTYDSNNDGKVDYVYAGDLKGNVWKFDVSGNSTSAWAVANIKPASGTDPATPQPIFVAKDSSGKVQPITAPVTAAKNTVTGDPNKDQVHIFFGTGSYFRVIDPNNKDTQTWYSIVDRPPAAPATHTSLLRSNMVQRSVLATGTFAGQNVRTFEAMPTTYDTGTKDGCFIDLPVAGERIVTASNLYRLAEPTLIASSIIPVIDQCEPGGTGYVNAINPFTCGRLGKPFFDVNNTNTFTDDLLGGNAIGSLNLNVGMPGEAIIVGNRLIAGGSEGTLSSVRINSGAIRPKGRISWREIISN